MGNFNNLPIGLKITTQIPLDAKEFSQNELTLSSLGTDNQLAYTYYDSLKVFCKDERTTYEWREVGEGEANTGLVDIDFTYPEGIIVDGVDYSNRTFNFFKITKGTDTIIQEGDNITITGTGSIEDPYIINADVTYTLPAEDTSPFKNLNEGNGIGIVKRDTDRTKYGNIGLRAFDVSYSDVTTPSYGALADYTFTSGKYSAAYNPYAFSHGNNAISSETGSISFGYLLDNGSIWSLVSSVNTEVYGRYNTVFGIGHQLTGVGCTIIGQAATIKASALTSNNLEDKELFVIGNGNIIEPSDIGGVLGPEGTVLSRSDAFIVKKKGTVEAPSLTKTKIADYADGANPGRILVTREYLEEQIDLVIAPVADIATQIEDAIRFMPNNRGYISGINPGSASSPTVYGDIVSATVSPHTNYSVVTVTVANSMVNENYYVRTFVQSLGTEANDSAVCQVSFKVDTLDFTVFYLILRETSALSQNLRIHIETVTY